MNKTKRFDLRAILMFLAVIMLTLSMVVFTACGKTEESASSGSSTTSSSSKEEDKTITDYQTLTNGDFEFGTDKTDKDKFPVNTGINWSRSNDSIATTASTSDYASGIINTDDEYYNTIAKDQDFPIESGEGDSAVYFNPHTPYYYGLVENSYAYSEDVKNEDKLPTTGSKVLMIHNKLKSSEGRGTAQKFTSSKTLDIQADSFVRVSLYVLTKDLKTVQDTTEFGAYVSLINTISSAKSPLVIKNINTNGNWAKVNIYVEGSDLAPSSYRLVLGLGNGSRKLQAEYVEGFAYFDNVTVETLTAEEYASAKANISSENSLSLFTADAENAGLYKDASKDELVVNTAGTTYESNGEKADSFDSTKKVTTLDYSLSFNIPSVGEKDLYSSHKLNAVYPHGGANFGSSAEIGEKAFSEIASKVDGTVNPLGDSAQTLYMIFPEIASYTLDTKSFQLKDGESMLLSFYAKVNIGNAQTGVTVNVVDLGTTTTQISEKNLINTAVNTNDYENKDTNDWAKFFIYVQNNVGDGKDRSFNLSIDFGPTETVTEYFTLPKGHALFTGFETTMLTEEQFKIASSTSNYTGNVTLGKDLLNGATSSEETTDTYSFKYSNTDNKKIEKGLANSVIDFTGVVGGHTMVDGEKTNYTQAETKSGIFNTKYIDNYTELSADEITSLKALKADGENKNVQALLINNTSATSYGYLGKSNTISANSTAVIAVKVKVFGDAKAYIYLANANPLEGFDVLSLTAPKWTFSDEDGVTYSDTETLVDKKYVQTVTASECTDDWTTVYFSVTAGKTDINYRVEVWNGSRDASETSQGMVAFEGVNTSASINQAQINADNEGGDVNEEKYQRAPTLVSYTNENGEEAQKYTHYNSGVVFTEYTKAKAIIATHATVDAETTLDETVDEPEEEPAEEETTTDENKPIMSMQIISVIIAIALVVALIAVIVRMMFKKTTEKEVKINEYYNRSTRDVANDKIAQNKARRAREEAELAKQAEAEPAQADVTEQEPEETTEEPATEEYDYENMENNIPKEDVETSEESAEAPKDDTDPNNN